MSDATIGNGSMRLLQYSLGGDGSLTISLDNQKVINEYPIYFQAGENELGVLRLISPYGVLADRIFDPNTEMFPNTSCYIDPVSQNVGFSGGNLNLAVHYKEDI